ncbi:MAG: RNA 2',3'-cyclic phosphodiesterase [ANME-2 cluster archaeon]|nr:RNA 2',3'-cyclic phosphodiesterase [ANME-2 cluster archaeon]
MIRTFIAVELPHDMTEAIRTIQQEMDFKGLKLVEPDLVHLTMKFLGDIPESQVEPISQALAGIDCPPFPAMIAGVGVFPKPAYMKVIWLGARGEFEHLHGEVERTLKEFRFKKDRGKFTAHATLARVRHLDEPTKEHLAQVLTGLQDVDLGEFTVEHITVKKSTLTPRGPIYETLKKIPL